MRSTGSTGTRSTADDAQLRRAIVRTTVRPVWIALAVVTVPFLLGLDLPLWLQYLPLAASALAFGLPHGAVDHLVPARLTGTDLGQSILAVVAVYLVLAGASLALWFSAPALAAALFVAITWIHWGQGDVYLLDAVSGGRYPRSIAHRVLVLVVRGAFPMAVPLIAAPDQYRAVVSNFVGLFGGSIGPLAVAFTPAFRFALGAFVVALTLATLARGLVVRGERTGVDAWTLDVDPAVTLDAAEMGILWAYFLVVPPILAVGLYFCLWHSMRHVARLIVLEPTGARALGTLDLRTALGRFFRDALPFTLVSLGFLAAFATVVPRAPSGLGEGIALYLVAIAVLTLPHVAVVTWMDHVQGIWSRDRA